MRDLAGRNRWLVKALLLSLIATAGAALVISLDRPATPVAAGEAVSHEAVADPAGVIAAVDRCEPEDQLEPTVVCLLIPECFRNADCDAVCGDGQGRCVRNTCPAKVCRCR